MMAALGTITFLATLWFLVVIAAAMFRDSGAKIAAALKGASFASATPQAMTLRIRARPRSSQPVRAIAPMRAVPRLRDAA